MNESIKWGKALTVAVASAILTSCNMNNNPLLTESKLPYGAPAFNEIKSEHYLPAFEQGIKEGKADIDAIVNCKEEPTFENTIEALEFAGETLTRVLGIFFALKEADTNDQMEEIAEKVTPMLNDYSMYSSLNKPLFDRVKAVYDKRDELGLNREQQRLLEKTYKSFVRSGALLSEENKKTFSKLTEEMSLASLQFGKNALAATNAYTLNLTKEEEVAGLPQFVLDLGAQTAKEKGQEGWTFDLSYPSYGPFMQYSERRDLRKQIYTAYNTKAIGGENDNTEVCRQIAQLRIKLCNMLGYKTLADYNTEERMVKSTQKIYEFIDELLEPSMPVAKQEVATLLAYAKENGFEEDELQPWDFSYWSEKYKMAKYAVSDEQLKPYFPLDSCIHAVFGLASKLYGLQFEERPDIPGYHPDVRVYDVKDETGRHMALFYADFFPRASKRSGAWMTEFEGQSIRNGVEHRPFVTIVTNFSKPTENTPSLLTHDELTTFMHEFGHSLHGMLTEASYPSLAGTSVDHDFVELPSQINENWAFEKEYLKPFAKHYQTGESIPDELVDKIIAAKNYMAAYGQVRQLQFALLDMAWHNLTELPAEGTLEYEDKILAPTRVIPALPGACISTAFNHIFAGGYAAGYYSYKWAEVLEADAYSLFQEKGIFNREVSDAFRREILSKGSTEDEATLYRNFRGHDPQPKALLDKLGITQQTE